MLQRTNGSLAFPHDSSNFFGTVTLQEPKNNHLLLVAG